MTAFDQMTLWTIGHSTRSAEEFLHLLQLHQIQSVADVRRFPGSRRYPHFNQESLQATLAGAGIGYSHFPQLGGRRQSRPDSPNTAWRNDHFRAYADFMETTDFRDGIERLSNKAYHRHCAVMCAEAVWWRCHRSLIADYLKAEGATVLHIMNAEAPKEHPYTSAATLVGGALSYRAPRQDNLFDSTNA